MKSTRNNNVSLFRYFMDTYSEHVHAVDMKEQVQNIANTSQLHKQSCEFIDFGLKGTKS